MTTNEEHTTDAVRPVSRKAAAIANLVHQYAAIALSIVNGIILVPLYLKHIDYFENKLIFLSTNLP